MTASTRRWWLVRIGFAVVIPLSAVFAVQSLAENDVVMAWSFGFRFVGAVLALPVFGVLPWPGSTRSFRVLRHIAVGTFSAGLLGGWSESDGLGAAAAYFVAMMIVLMLSSWSAEIRDDPVGADA